MYKQMKSAPQSGNFERRNNNYLNSVYAESPDLSSPQNNVHVNERIQDIFSMFFGGAKK